MLLQVIGFGLAVLLASTFLDPNVIGARIHRINSRYVDVSRRLAYNALRIGQKSFSTETESEQSILQSGVTSGVTLTFIALLVLGIVYNWVWLVWFASINLSFYLIAITAYFTLMYKEDPKWQERSNLRLAFTVCLRSIFTVVLAAPISFLTLLLFLMYATVVVLLALPAGKDIIRRTMILIGTPLIFIGMLLQYLNSP
ncbi:MAG TPA: hypothetical protein G4O18_08080 [Dehalococcoidia bacterium]|nr:hypothetical protein [Dehalococcoidia bacterium]